MTEKKKKLEPKLTPEHRAVIDKAKKVLEEQGKVFKFSNRLSPKENAAKFEAGTALKLREIEGEDWKHEIRFGVADIKDDQFAGTMHVCDEKKERMISVQWSVKQDTFKEEK